MDGKSSESSISMPGGSYSFSGLQGSVQGNEQENSHSYQTFMAIPQQVQEIYPFRVRNFQERDQSLSFYNYDSKNERLKDPAGDDDDGSNFVEGVVDRQNEGCRGNKELTWHRVKWTDKMVKLLITAVSYIGEEASFDCNGVGRRKSAPFPKKGKWKYISKVMAERGYHVSPQQCEDKFNDLNKRYKRLNDILGRGTSCKVVENPALMDLMDLSEKAKDDVRKILSSKQLFYEEMCSYHNGNRLCLPHDQALQRSLQLALNSKDSFDIDEEDQDVASDDCNGQTQESPAKFNSNGGSFLLSGVSATRNKQGKKQEVVDFGNRLNHVFTGSGETEQFQNPWLIARSVQLEEQMMQIQAQLVELEKQRFKWMRNIQQEDRELEKMKLENECMKFENERLALKLKRREAGADARCIQF